MGPNADMVKDMLSKEKRQTAYNRFFLCIWDKLYLSEMGM